MDWREWWAPFPLHPDWRSGRIHLVAAAKLAAAASPELWKARLLAAAAIASFAATPATVHAHARFCARRQAVRERGSAASAADGVAGATSKSISASTPKADLPTRYPCQPSSGRHGVCRMASPSLYPRPYSLGMARATPSSRALLCNQTGP